METLYRDTFLAIVKKNLRTINHIIQSQTHHDLTTWRDSGDGWTALEVLCHIADYDEIFYTRAVSMIEQDKPTFVGHDHEAMAIDKQYNAQNPADVLARLNTSRTRFIAFFEGLTDEQFLREGIHPEYGQWWVQRSLSQLAYHDSNHIEQMTRTLAEKQTK
jgi:hypothetical protein